MAHLENLTSPDDIARAIDGADAIFLNPRAVGAGYDLLLASLQTAASGAPSHCRPRTSRRTPHTSLALQR